jgi:thioesterase domain-containing protein
MLLLEDVIAVPLNSVDADERIYLVGGADGQVGDFRHLAQRLTQVSVTGLLLARPMPAGTTVSELAATFRMRIRAAGINARTHIGGFSYGAYVAAEMARQQIGDESLGVLLLLDTVVRPGRQAQTEPFQGQWYLARDHGYGGTLEEFLALAPPDRVMAVASQWRGGSDIRSSRKWVSQVFTTIERNLDALGRHVVGEYPGDVGVVIAEDSDMTSMRPELWKPAFPAGVRLAAVPGSHEDIPTEDVASDLAKALLKILAA